jgi:hypothetical protein
MVSLVEGIDGHLLESRALAELISKVVPPLPMWWHRTIAYAERTAGWPPIV